MTGYRLVGVTDVTDHDNTLRPSGVWSNSIGIGTKYDESLVKDSFPMFSSQAADHAIITAN